MATNKHASIRYQALDKCFRNSGRKYFMEDLIEACKRAIYEFTGNENGVKRRQIFDDIRYMESEQGWNAPIEHIPDGKRVYYRYEDLKYSINNQPLNDSDTNSLKEAILTLSRFKGLPQFDWVDELTTRLRATLGGIQENEKFIDFEQNEFLEGTVYIGVIYNAIIYKNPLKVCYKNFQSLESINFNFHPYYLKQYKNRWFAFGWSDERNQLTNLALDRICSLEEISIPYIPNDKIDFNEYFDEIIGVTLFSEKNPEKILFKVNNNLYPYIKTKPLHGSQTVKVKTQDFTIIQICVIPNYELEALILSYGEGVEVLEPIELRNKIKCRVKLILENYNK